jgi:hypothetical protein
VVQLTAQGRLSFETFVLLHVLFAAAWLTGGEQRARRAYTALVEDRAARLERELGYLAREAVADQRVRLTRELHRTVTDSVSTMVARARAAGQRLPAVASGSRDLLGVIETGERVLAELRRGSEVLSPADPGPGWQVDPDGGRYGVAVVLAEKTTDIAGRRDVLDCGDRPGCLVL